MFTKQRQFSSFLEKTSKKNPYELSKCYVTAKIFSEKELQAK